MQAICTVGNRGPEHHPYATACWTDMSPTTRSAFACQVQSIATTAIVYLAPKLLKTCAAVGGRLYVHQSNVCNGCHRASSCTNANRCQRPAPACCPAVQCRASSGLTPTTIGHETKQPQLTWQHITHVTWPACSATAANRSQNRLVLMGMSDSRFQASGTCMGAGVAPALDEIVDCLCDCQTSRQQLQGGCLRGSQPG